MVQAKRKVEGRIADAGTFCIQEYWSPWPYQDIFWAYIAMDHGLANTTRPSA